MGRYLPGKSYNRRKEAVLRLYLAYERSGLSNRTIWRRYIYPEFGITERTLYKYLKKSEDF